MRSNYSTKRGKEWAVWEGAKASHSSSIFLQSFLARLNRRSKTDHGEIVGRAFSGEAECGMEAYLERN
jgi:hypothetical protein